jgi:hypothetical protein
MTPPVPLLRLDDPDVAVASTGHAALEEQEIAIASTLTTVTFFTVTLLVAGLTGHLLAREDPDGHADRPMEPGARWNIEPWVARPPPKPWRLITPWKPRPFDRPMTWTFSSASKMSARTESPGLASSPASTGTSPRQAGRVERRPRRSGPWMALGAFGRDWTPPDRAAPPRSRRIRSTCAARRCTAPPRRRSRALRARRRRRSGSCPLSCREFRVPCRTSPCPVGLDLDVDTGRQLELHQSIDGLLGRARGCPTAACACGSRTARATSCPRAESATR